MRKTIFTILFCLSLIRIFSQNAEQAIDFSRYGTAITSPSYINRAMVKDLINEIERVNRSQTAEDLNETILNRIEGTPFMNNQFVEGELFTVENKKISEVLLRFNVYNNIMEAKFNESIFILSKEFVKRIKVENKTFDYLPCIIAGKQDSAYLELIEAGVWSLYCYHSKKFKAAQPQKAMQDKPSPAAFRDLPVIYLIMKSDENKAIGFRNRKELIRVFNTNKDEIRTYIKKHKLKHNNRADLKKLLSFLNSF